MASLNRHIETGQAGPAWLRITRTEEGWTAKWRGRSVTCDRHECHTEAEFRALVMQEMFDNAEAVAD